MNKIVALVTLIPFLVVTLIIGGFVLIVYQGDNTGPVYFSLDDSKATYTIKKTESRIPNAPHYWVVHNSSTEIFVGNSKIELESYVGKNIKITGSYTGRLGKEQCIVNKCTPFGVRALLIDIDSIEIN